MNTLLQHIEWLDKRVQLAAIEKDYVIFAMQEYARKYHESKVKNLGICSVSGSAFTLASEEYPATYETGAWDGKRSDVLILLLEDGKYVTGRLYSGFMDGSEFNNWYDATDSEMELTNVEAWAVIPK